MDDRVPGRRRHGPPTDLADLLVRDEHEEGGIVLTSLAVTSWAEWYADADPATIVHPMARPLVERVGHRCMATTEQGLGDVPDVALLERCFLSTDPGQAPVGATACGRIRRPPHRRRSPLLVAQGLSDTLVRPAVTEALVRPACAAGAPVELDTYPVGRALRGPHGGCPEGQDVAARPSAGVAGRPAVPHRPAAMTGAAEGER